MNEDMKWMDFSGAPPILVPERCVPFWNGHYREVDENEYDEEVSSDRSLIDSPFMQEFALPDGREFEICEEMDLGNPATDFERLATLQSGHGSLPVGPAEIMVFQDYSDGCVGWLPSQDMLLTVSRHLPDLSQIEEA